MGIRHSAAAILRAMPFLCCMPTRSEVYPDQTVHIIVAFSPRREPTTATCLPTAFHNSMHQTFIR